MLVGLVGLGLGGCASLPEPPATPPTSFLIAPEDAPLARLASDADVNAGRWTMVWASAIIAADSAWTRSLHSAVGSPRVKRWPSITRTTPGSTR